MSCEPTLAGMWTKNEEVSKSQGSSESSFSTKVKSRAEARVEKTLAISSFKHWKTRSDIFEEFERKFGKFLGMFLGIKTKLYNMFC